MRILERGRINPSEGWVVGKSLPRNYLMHHIRFCCCVAFVCGPVCVCVCVCVCLCDDPLRVLQVDDLWLPKVDDLCFFKVGEQWFLKVDDPWFLKVDELWFLKVGDL